MRAATLLLCAIAFAPAPLIAETSFDRLETLIADNQPSADILAIYQNQTVTLLDGCMLQFEREVISSRLPNRISERFDLDAQDLSIGNASRIVNKPGAMRLVVPTVSGDPTIESTITSTADTPEALETVANLDGTCDGNICQTPMMLPELYIAVIRPDANTVADSILEALAAFQNDCN